MQEQPTNRQWRTIELSAKDFNSRLNQLMVTQTLFSRLALIHQVAKAFAAEEVNKSGNMVTNLEIEEITDPPLYGYTPDDDPVIIQFSYSNRNTDTPVL